MSDNTFPQSTDPVDTAPVTEPITTPSDTVDTTSTSSGGTVADKLAGAKDAAINTAQSTISAISNNQAVQDLKNGPVAQNVSKEASKTSSELKDLYTTRDIPSDPAATGQSLTHYHSLFYRLLSWQNPRATSITFIGTILFIFAARYLNVLKYAFKFAYFILGVTASLEIAGKLLFDDGLTSKMRPRKYWTIPRESLERSLDDVEQLINFFVIESQRILYAENIYATIAVFTSALISYWLIKLVPFWGLCLISTCVLYLTPLIYVKNQEAIDSSLNHVGNMVSTQASQIKNITAEQTGKATESFKSYAGEYTGKAQQFINSKKPGSTASPSTTPKAEFPAVPQVDPASPTPVAGQGEPLLAQ